MRPDSQKTKRNWGIETIIIAIISETLSYNDNLILPVETMHKNIIGARIVYVLDKIFLNI